jgi:hypothetical protein
MGLNNVMTPHQSTSIPHNFGVYDHTVNKIHPSCSHYGYGCYTLTNEQRVYELSFSDFVPEIIGMGKEAT